MSIARREFLKASALAAASLAVPRPLLAQIGRRLEPVPPIDDPRLKELALKGLEAARSAGASYADVRLTHDWGRGISEASVADKEAMTVGVRALRDGYWGFASGPVWSADEMARLGREAVHQAKTNALGKPRTVTLAPVAPVPDGNWIMPVERDPFEVPPDEVRDYLRGLAYYTGRIKTSNAGAARNVARNEAFFVKQEKAFASTVGSYCTQRLYRTGGNFDIILKEVGGQLDTLSPAGVGWELYTGQPIREQIRQLLAELEEDLMLPVKPVDVGRYDTVFDAGSVTNLLDETLGRATELDRALGYEANAGGTSYLNAPLEMLGSYQTGAPLLTVTANRAEPGGCATVRWDDEGVVPDEFPIVQDGVIADFQTTRESAGWLKDYYSKSGKSFRSHGCANADSAISAPLQHSPNLVLTPGREAVDFEGLVAELPNGIAIRDAQLSIDFQHLNGLALGRTYEVKRGKRIARLNAAGVLFRAPELWKGLLALGGPKSVRRYGATDTKGEPAQTTYHSVTAPPALFKQLTLIDALRRA